MITNKLELNSQQINNNKSISTQPTRRQINMQTRALPANQHTRSLSMSQQSTFQQIHLSSINLLTNPTAHTLNRADMLPNKANQKAYSRRIKACSSISNNKSKNSNTSTTRQHQQQNSTTTTTTATTTTRRPGAGEAGTGVHEREHPMNTPPTTQHDFCFLVCFLRRRKRREVDLRGVVVRWGFLEKRERWRKVGRVRE